MGYNAAVLAAVPAVLPIVAGSIAASWSWRAVFVLYSVAFVTACAVRVSLDDGVTLDRVSVARQLRGATQSLRERGIRQPIGVGFVVFLLIYGVTLTILPIVLSTRLDVGPLGRGALLSLPALTSTAASLSIGRLSARFHDRGIVRAGLVVLGLGCLVTGIGSVQAVVVGALLAGLGEGLVIPGLLLTLDQSLTTSRRGVVMAVWVASARAGQTAGAGAAGLSLAALGLGQTTSIAAALGLTTVAWMHFHPVEQIGAFR
jgi:predicted MFS family arabinose efflux permease